MSDKPPSLPGTKEFLSKLANGEIKVHPAPQIQTKALSVYVMRVLEAVGHPEAWVSDASSIGDFRPMFGKHADYQEFLDEVSLKLAMQVKKGEGIVNIAMRLMAQEQKQDEQN